LDKSVRDQVEITFWRLHGGSYV